jgi:hypothetical protein
MYSQSPSSSVGLIAALATKEDQTITLQDTLWRVLEDSSNTLDKRCDLAAELLKSDQSTTLLKEGVLDHLALEATQTLLNSQSADVESTKVQSFLITCMGPSCKSHLPVEIHADNASPSIKGYNAGDLGTPQFRDHAYGQ